VKTIASLRGKRAIVLDTSAFVAGFDPFSVSEEQYTVPAVKDEMARKSISSFKFETAEESGKIRVEEPNEHFLDTAKKTASQVGDTFFLSDVDLQVLALAFQLKACGYLPLIATDDYSIQNVAKQANIEFASLVTFGIRRRLEWLRYCPACHKTYSAGFKSSSCDICGTLLKRKPVREKQTSDQ
jgi:UPF0271 protein